MAEHPIVPPDDPAAATARLRKADFWTGLVLAAVAIAMVAEALTFPLEGTYAGVRNAWYVSPALFPLIVGGLLALLSLGLVGKALADYRRLSPGGRLLAVDWAAGFTEGRDAWLVAVLLTAYIVGLVPRVDFVIGTVLFLAAFIGVYMVASAAGRALLVALMVIPSVAAFAVAVAGAWPAPRSAGQSLADALVMAVAAAALVVLVAAADRRRFATQAAATAVLTPVVLAVLFKYGLLVPLPREGLATLGLERLAGILG